MKTGVQRRELLLAAALGLLPAAAAAAAEADDAPFEDAGAPLQRVEPATDDDGARAGTGDSGEPDRSEEPDGGAAAAAVVVPPLPPVPPVVSGPSEHDLALIPALDGTPESVVEAAAGAHPKSVGALLLSERLAKGINTKSGSCLKDLYDLAQELFIMLKDAKNALAVADLLNVLPFDGNRGRWYFGSSNDLRLNFLVKRYDAAPAAVTAFSMPRLITMGLAPAVTFFRPSRTMAWASAVEVLVPSPATSLVLVATSFTSWAPMFSNGSSNSISRAIVTPSLATAGAPNFLSSTTLRPRGPRVTFTVLARALTPASSLRRAASSNRICFAGICQNLPN